LALPETEAAFQVADNALALIASSIALIKASSVAAATAAVIVSESKVNVIVLKALPPVESDNKPLPSIVLITYLADSPKSFATVTL